jgi:hypothetical protein
MTTFLIYFLAPMTILGLVFFVLLYAQALAMRERDNRDAGTTRDPFSRNLNQGDE